MFTNLYYIDYKHIFQTNAIPEFVLNIQTHGILAIGLCLDYFTSCTQIFHHVFILTRGTLYLYIYMFCLRKKYILCLMYRMAEHTVPELKDNRFYIIYIYFVIQTLCTMSSYTLNTKYITFLCV